MLYEFLDGNPEGFLFYLRNAIKEFFEHLSMKLITPILSSFPAANPAFCWLTNHLLKNQQET